MISQCHLGAKFTQGKQGAAVDRLWWLRKQTRFFQFFFSLFTCQFFHLHLPTFLSTSILPSLPLINVSQINKQLAMVAEPQLGQLNYMLNITFPGFRVQSWVTVVMLPWRVIYLIITFSFSASLHPSLTLLLSPAIPFLSLHTREYRSLTVGWQGRGAY